MTRQEAQAIYRVERCKACGQSLDTVHPARIERRQVHDLPAPKLEITEHQGETKTCSRGCVNRARFPPEAPAPVQYGPRLKGSAVYLNEHQLIPFERTGEILRDLHGCKSFSQSTLANFKADCAARLEPVEAAILAQVTAAPVAHFDETGVRAEGSPHWLHTVCTEVLTWYHAHKNRGTQARMPPASCPPSKAVPSTTSGNPTSNTTAPTPSATPTCCANSSSSTSSTSKFGPKP